MLGSCRQRSALRGHGPVEEGHLRDLWVQAQASDFAWRGLIDFGAYGVAEETGRAGSAWAPSFDRLDNALGYVAGNVTLVPNILNRTCNRYDRRLVIDLVVRASRFRKGELPETGDTGQLKCARPHGERLETRLAHKGAQLFKLHQALVPHQAEMMRIALDALYGPGGGVCRVTGLMFVPELGHPCFPSWDLIDHELCSQHRYAGTGKAKRTVATTCGRETPTDMRLVCQFFNLGRNVWSDADWWRMADHVRRLVEAGVPT
jgi:hypothetical protein